LAFATACGGDDDANAGMDSEEGFSTQNALEHARLLAEDIGSRPAGSDAELQAAQYIRGQLNSYGYEAELQPFPVRTVQDFGSDLTVTYAGGSRSLLKIAFSDSASGEAEGPLVYAGLGNPEEFPADTPGSIVLIERGVLPFSRKVANAEAAGAAGVLIYNSEPGLLAGRLNDPSNLPAATLSREDGLALVDLIENETVSGRFSIDFRAADTEQSNNVITLPADGGCRHVVGGHYDSVPAGPGANDNASGTAVVIEIARVLAQTGETDGVCFALFGGEETGLLGSRAYVQALTADELGGIEAMLNFDMLAVGEGWPLTGSTELADLVGEVAEGLDIPYRFSSASGLGSDHAPFIEARVPALMFNCFCDPNYHTSADRFRFLAEQRIAEAGALGLGLLEALRAG
jgi:aminopeptidase YwaD